MNNVMAMTALAAGVLMTSAAFAAPANLADTPQPASGVILVKGGGGGGFVGGGHMGGGGAGHIGGARIGGDAGPHFSGGDRLGAGPKGGSEGPHFGANGHQGDGRGHFDRDHFDHDHGRHVRFFPGDAFFYGAGYGYYDGDCEWILRQARATGSAYWWRRYNECIS
ncbi:MAG TPA: hypothetical protein VHK26_07890 [Methyloceanibacter sp.]|jgi:hypothetical protein|nr:hypothetical protein [Methyloceanibacter sp.]